jgi:purine nucleoside permease
MKLPTASCRLSYRLDGREIVYSVELSRQTAFYEKTSYEALRAFYQKVVEAQRRPILLRCTAPAPTAP